MAATHKSTLVRAVTSNARNVVSLPVCGAREREAMELALAHLIERKIKPKMKLKEFADFYETTLKRVQDDVEGGICHWCPERFPTEEN